MTLAFRLAFKASKIGKYHLMEVMFGYLYFMYLRNASTKTALKINKQNNGIWTIKEHLPK